MTFETRAGFNPTILSHVHATKKIACVARERCAKCGVLFTVLQFARGLQRLPPSLGVLDVLLGNLKKPLKKRAVTWKARDGTPLNKQRQVTFLRKRRVSRPHCF